MLKQGSEIKENTSIGQEFIEWAENYWQLKEIVNIKNPDQFAGEKYLY